MLDLQNVGQQVGPVRSGPLSPEHSRSDILRNPCLGEVIQLALTALQTILIWSFCPKESWRML